MPAMTLRTSEQALNGMGFDGERLMKLARKVGSDYLRAHSATLPSHRFEDLVSFLCEQGLRASMRYDSKRVQVSYGRNGGDPASSYLADIMEQRCTDYYRSKAEGNGDRRYGNDNRVVLSEMDGDVDPDIDFDRMVSDRAAAKWQRAADIEGMRLVDYVVVAVEEKTARVLGRAA